LRRRTKRHLEVSLVYLVTTGHKQLVHATLHIPLDRGLLTFGLSCAHWTWRVSGQEESAVVFVAGDRDQTVLVALHFVFCAFVPLFL
jgi:hypothetical protein